MFGKIWCRNIWQDAVPCLARSLAMCSTKSGATFGTKIPCHVFGKMYVMPRLVKLRVMSSKIPVPCLAGRFGAKIFGEMYHFRHDPGKIFDKIWGRVGNIPWHVFSKIACHNSCQDPVLPWVLQGRRRVMRWAK